MLDVEIDVKPPKEKKKRPQSYATAQASRGKVGWLERSDKRGPVARRFRDIAAIISADLGGFQDLSEAQRQIIRRISSMSVWCESQEAKMADGEEIDIDRFQRSSNSLRRLCESIGLKRVAKDISNVIDYAADRATEQEGDDNG